MSQTKAQLIDNLVQPITGAAGSASAPTFSFTADPNTGLYSPGADQLAISTNGTGRLFVDASGNVGVGTNVPQQGLHVHNSGSTASRIRITNSTTTDAAGKGLQFTQSGVNSFITNNETGDLAFATSATERMRLDSSGRLGLGTSSPSYTLDVTGSARITSASPMWLGTTTGDAYIQYGASATTANNWTVGSQADGSFRFFNGTYASGTERLRITSDGKVGVGTTSVDSPLHVVAASGAPLIKGAASTGTNACYMQLENTAGGFIVGRDNSSGGILGGGAYASHLYSQGAYPIVFSTNSTQRAQIDSSGRLLVGTSSSQSTNNYSDTGYSPRNQFAINDYDGVASFTNWTNSVGMNNNGGTVIFFNRCTSNSSGTHTGGALVNGDKVARLVFNASDGTAFRTAASIEVAMDGTTGASDVPGRLLFSTTADGASSPTERMRILQNGEILGYGVYNFTTSNAANVYVFSSGELRRSTSSSKYKQDIETLQDAYADALLNCRPVWYRSTCDKDNPNWGWWGFIAEEVAAIDPRLVHWKTIEVTYDEKGSAVETPCEPEPEGVAYDRFVPHLLNLIKRQQQAIEALQAEVAALKAQ